MSRLQLAIDVANLEEAIQFYSRMFSSEPSKVRPGYANFTIEEPPLKLVLVEDIENGGSINHLGVEVDDVRMVHEADARMTDEGLTTTGIDETMCCYADKTETWIDGPDDIRWEWYVKSGDNEQFEKIVVSSEANCCEN
ncbi:MAG: ArsI/CadI family heavy metal resistance metalloenzyme [Candidatus Poriferisodalaceae bacterium]|nr:MAG: glyoxalase/bleomycin resistance/extradiol dioxygenase family protein [Acidimicrobiales bacterium MED-G01]|tara:strand:+ start:617 stop:1033 length:417 start_codon:yes stop_codon:yes gene_type:complete